MDNKIINVLVVDDSPVSRDLLTYIIESDPSLRVVAKAENGEEAIKLVQQHRPNVVMMDIVMPIMNGFEATRHIMEVYPIPIIIVSGIYNPQEVDQCYQAISAGALAILEKPTGIRDPRYAEMAYAITQAIKSLAEIKIKASSHLVVQSQAKAAPPATSAPKPLTSIHGDVPLEIIGIGASIGGPQALYTILSKFPAAFPASFLVVQQISTGFTKGLVDWLSTSCALKVKLAQNKELIMPGTVYIAPDNFHMEVMKGNFIQLIDAPPEHGLRPSIGHLFQSMAKNLGSKSVGILLSGRGVDGVDGLLAIKKQGGKTIVQDEDSSVMFDKPQKAIQAGAVSHITPLSQITHTIETLIKTHV